MTHSIKNWGMKVLKSQIFLTPFMDVPSFVGGVYNFVYVPVGPL